MVMVEDDGNSGDSDGVLLLLSYVAIVDVGVGVNVMMASKDLVALMAVMLMVLVSDVRGGDGSIE